MTHVRRERGRPLAFDVEDLGDVRDAFWVELERPTNGNPEIAKHKGEASSGQ